MSFNSKTLSDSNKKSPSVTVSVDYSDFGGSDSKNSRVKTNILLKEQSHSKSSKVKRVTFDESEIKSGIKESTFTSPKSNPLGLRYDNQNVSQKLSYNSSGKKSRSSFKSSPLKATLTSPMAKSSGKKSESKTPNSGLKQSRSNNSLNKLSEKYGISGQSDDVINYTRQEDRPENVISKPINTKSFNQTQQITRPISTSSYLRTSYQNSDALTRMEQNLTSMRKKYCSMNMPQYEARPLSRLCSKDSTTKTNSFHTAYSSMDNINKFDNVTIDLSNSKPLDVRINEIEQGLDKSNNKYSNGKDQYDNGYVPLYLRPNNSCEVNNINKQDNENKNYNQNYSGNKTSNINNIEEINNNLSLSHSKARTNLLEDQVDLKPVLDEVYSDDYSLDKNEEYIPQILQTEDLLKEVNDTDNELEKEVAFLKDQLFNMKEIEYENNSLKREIDQLKHLEQENITLKADKMKLEQTIEELQEKCQRLSKSVKSDVRGEGFISKDRDGDDELD